MSVFSVFAPFVVLLWSLASASSSVPSELEWIPNGSSYMSQNAVNGSVSVASFQNLEHLFYRDSSSDFLTHLTSTGNNQWTTQKLPIEVLNAPALISSVDGTRLHIFYPELHTQHVLHVYEDGNGNYVRPVEDDLQIQVVEPSAAVSTTDNSICVIGASTFGSRLLFSKRIQTDNSSSYHTVSSGWTGFATSSSGSLVWWNNSFHAFYLEARGLNIVHIQSSDCNIWQKVTVDNWDTTFRSFSRPAAFVLPATDNHPAELRILYRDTQETLSQCASFDGIIFQAATDTLTYFKISSPSSAAWISTGHVLLAGGDIYQSGSGSIYTGISYARASVSATSP